MILDRASEKLAGWLGSIPWLLRLNRRLKVAAARWRPVRLVLATLAAVTRSDAQQLVAGVAYYGIVALIPVSVGVLQFSGVRPGRRAFLGLVRELGIPGDAAQH